MNLTQFKNCCVLWYFHVIVSVQKTMGQFDYSQAIFSSFSIYILLSRRLYKELIDYAVSMFAFYQMKWKRLGNAFDPQHNTTNLMFLYFCIVLATFYYIIIRNYCSIKILIINVKKIHHASLKNNLMFNDNIIIYAMSWHAN